MPTVSHSRHNALEYILVVSVEQRYAAPAEGLTGDHEASKCLDAACVKAPNPSRTCETMISPDRKSAMLGRIQILAERNPSCRSRYTARRHSIVGRKFAVVGAKTSNTFPTLLP